MAVEVERKFLLTSDHWDDLKRVAVLEKVTTLEQFYLIDKNGVECRLRSESQGGTISCYVTVKVETNDVNVRSEYEFEISSDVYAEYAEQRTIILCKRRHYMSFKDLKFTVDTFLTPKGLIILEIEFDSLESAIAFELPSFLKGVKEVTGDKAYKNKNIFKSIDADDLVY